jgi:transposase
MKVTEVAEIIKLDQIMDVSVDVHKEDLYSLARVPGKEYAETFKNSTPRIRKVVKDYQRIAQEHGYSQIRIICEPTGVYDRKLLRTARLMGAMTSYVNAEAVSKFRVVENNDNNKTDIADPGVILRMAEHGHTIRHRILDDDYVALRKLGSFHDAEEVMLVRIRGSISQVREELFCEWDFDKDFLYGNSGNALIAKYGANPYRIVRSSFIRFSAVMKRAVPRIRRTSLERLWAQAQVSVLNEQPDSYISVLEERLKNLHEDFWCHKNRKTGIEEEMIVILRRLKEKDPTIPTATPGVISEKNLARLLGETGPLSDFDSAKRIMRYAGLNLCMRQSGTYKGKFKISKKGRPLLRKILSQISLQLVRKGALYGDYYHEKKERQDLPGAKALTIVMRHFLRKFYGWYRSEQEFDKERFFVCQGDYKKVA